MVGLGHDGGMKPAFTLLPLLLMAACTQFPELDATETPGVAEAPYPALVPLVGLLEDKAPPRATPEVIDEVEARAGGLEARAEALQGVEGGQTRSVEERLRLLRQKAEALRSAE